MPIRRSTRVKKRQRAPVQPDSTITEEERKGKMEIFLHEFDETVQQKLKLMEQDKVKTLRNIEKLFTFELLQLPASIKKMTLEDYIAAGGTIVKVVASEETSQSTTSSVPATSSRTINRPKIDVIEESIPEERRSRRQNMMKPPVGRSKMITPNVKGFATGRWETPSITPKVDPRLPISATTARIARPGEISWSLAGSPLLSNTARKRAPSKKQKNGLVELQLGGSCIMIEKNNIEFTRQELKRGLGLLNALVEKSNNH